jgi:hypothetical protein
MIAEVDRFQPPDPPSSRVDEILAGVRGRVGAGAWTSALRHSGADEDLVRAFVRDSLRLEAYLRQRFGVLAEPGDEAVRQAYEQRRAAAPPGSAVPPFETLRATIQDQLREARYRALLAEWVVELRQRADISVRGVPAGAAW